MGLPIRCLLEARVTVPGGANVYHRFTRKFELSTHVGIGFKLFNVADDPDTPPEQRWMRVEWIGWDETTKEALVVLDDAPFRDLTLDQARVFFGSKWQCETDLIARQPPPAPLKAAQLTASRSKTGGPSPKTN